MRHLSLRDVGLSGSLRGSKGFLFSGYPSYLFYLPSSSIGYVYSRLRSRPRPSKMALLQIAACLPSHRMRFIIPSSFMLHLTQ